MNVHLKFLSPSATVYTHKLFGNGQMLRLSVKKKTSPACIIFKACSQGISLACLVLTNQAADADPP